MSTGHQRERLLCRDYALAAAMEAANCATSPGRPGWYLAAGEPAKSGQFTWQESNLQRRCDRCSTVELQVNLAGITPSLDGPERSTRLNSHNCEGIYRGHFNISPGPGARLTSL